MKTFGAIWRKSFKEIPEYFQPFRRAPDLRKTTQMERKNSTLFSRISKFFQPIFLSYKNFSHAKFWYDPHAGCVLSMLKVWAKSQFTIPRKIEIRVLPYGRFLSCTLIIYNGVGDRDSSKNIFEYNRWEKISHILGILRSFSFRHLNWNEPHPSLTVVTQLNYNSNNMSPWHDVSGSLMAD